MSNSDQQAPNNSTNQNQPAPPPYGNSVPPSSNPPNNSNPPNSNNNQGNANPWGQMMPPYGYPYPFPNQPQAPTSGENSNNQQQQNQAPPFPYPPYPYPPYGFPYPPNQGGQQPNSNTNQQFPYPYPPFGYPPYPFPYPPQQNNSGDSKQQQQQPQFPYPPYGYPPYPYPYPPQQQPPQQPPQPQAQQQQQKQQPQRQNNQQQQQPQYSPFDWERRGLPSFDSKSNNNNNSNNQQSQFDHTPFDWETGNNEPQKKIEIDWNYKSEYDVPDVPPDVERNTSVSAECKSRAFDPSTLPALDDSFYKLFPSEIASQAKANSQRRNFHARNKSSAKETFRIRFQFSQEEISDLSVSATFHIKEHTHKLYDFLNEVVFNEGTKFVIRTSVPAKAIGNNHNQQLRDVKITGNTILFVKISVFTGLKDDVNQQYTLQKTAIAEKLKQLEEEKKSQTPQ